MADYIIVKESNRILKEFSVEKSDNLLCPILKVLQMRHNDLDMKQATRVVRDVLGQHD